MYPIIDWHCDALMKLALNPEINFYDSEILDINVLNLRAGGVKVQAFALFIDPEIPVEEKYETCLKQIEMFKTKVLTQKDFVQIWKFQDIDTLKDSQIGVFLTLEGLDCVGSDLKKVKHLLDEGVLSIGMTWNVANLACDGVGEIRGAGLTEFGFDVVALMNEHKRFIDVSHISLKGFDDVITSADHVIASHSNVRSVHDHRRNLNDAQLDAFKRKGSPMHLVYLDAFITNRFPAPLDALLDHLDYLEAYGMINQIGLGSDFDGISTKVTGLENASQAQNLLNHIASRYGDTTAYDIAYNNFMRYALKHAL